MITKIRKKKEAGFSLLELSVAVGVSAIVASAGIVATTAFIGGAAEKRDNYVSNAETSIENAESSSLALGAAGVVEGVDYYLALNGVTVKCPGVEVGEEFELNDTTYTKRDKASITTSNAANTCTTGIAEMNYMFRDATAFNQDISHWDVSDVTSIYGMFRGAYAFNQPIGSWDMSNVTNMSMIFSDALAFNQDISGWDVSSVKNMGEIFYIGTNLIQDSDGNSSSKFSSFNQPIGSWDVSNVEDMNRMFFNNKAFNQDIGDWDVSNVTEFENMFMRTIFNQDLSGWCVTEIASEPSRFSTNNIAWVLPKPSWGTCPTP